MIDVISVENMRKSDAYTIEHTTPSLELMKKAGIGIYNSYNWHGKTLIVCGSGNNAGDGYVLADQLIQNNQDTTLFLVKNKFSSDSEYYFNELDKKALKVKFYGDELDFNSFDTIVDCIFGTGFKGDVVSPIKEIIENINNSKAYKISVDINSGLNGDSGLANIAVKSDLTIAIGNAKTGFYLNSGKDYVGDIKIIDIGIKPIDPTYSLYEKDDLNKLFKKRLNISNKGTYVYIGLIGGSLPYSGAIRLANLANASMNAGSGVTMLGVPKFLSPLIIPHILESTIYPLSDDGEYFVFKEEEFKGLMNKTKAIAIGMGIGNTKETKKAIEYLIKNYDKKLIIDADGLNALSELDSNILKESKAKIILTPHLKEFQRLSGYSLDEIKNNSINLAQEYAKNNNIILLLKGPTTIITDGNKINLVNRGCPGMATAGSGDVLSGIISAVVAQNDDLLYAVTGAAWINGRAGELAEEKYSAVSMLASNTVEFIKDAILEILK